MKVDLPDPQGRMTPIRKSEIVRAMRAGQASRAWLLTRYGLSEDELRAWERDFDAGGVKALTLDHLQAMRS